MAKFLEESVKRIWIDSSRYVGAMEEESASIDMFDVITALDSPIEQMFYCALVATARVNAWKVITSHTEYQDPAKYIRRDSERHSVWCWPQSKIGNYRADFIVHLVDGPSSGPVVVELDGHQWHDRDEKQRRYEKTRDRDMQRLGFRVARFTGAEIFADPYKAAVDVLRLSILSDGGYITPAEYLDLGR